MAGRKRTRKRSNAYKTAVAVIVIIALLAVGIWYLVQFFNKKPDASDRPFTGTASEDLDIHFVDVGQGDACVIELPDERKMLIDSGESDSSDKLIKYIEQNVKRDERSLTYLDIVIMTHSDSDHCGEMKDVLTKFPAKTVYRPNQEATYKKGEEGFFDPGEADLIGDYNGKNTRTYYNAITAAYAENSSFTPEVLITDARDEAKSLISPEDKNPGDEGYYTITFYTPNKDKYTDFNDYSPILVLEYMGKRITLSGDAEAKAEAEFVEKANSREGKFSVFTDNFTADVIKLGHHGSRTSSSEAYLEVMTTAASRPGVIIVISCGTGNNYGHPHPEVIERLLKMGFSEANFMRTDLKGTIKASVTKDEQGFYRLQTTSERSAA